MTAENGEDLQPLLIHSFSLLDINEPIIFIHIIPPSPHPPVSFYEKIIYLISSSVQ
jgi:hypothetical protein